MKTAIKLFFAIFFLIPSLSFASTIVLKDGQKLEGKIVERTDKYIKYDAGIGVVTTFYDDEIDTIDGKNFQAVAVPVAVAAPAVQPTQAIEQLPIPQADKPTPIPTDATVTKVDTSIISKINSGAFNSPQQVLPPSNPQNEFTITHGDSVFTFTDFSDEPVDLHIFANNRLPFENNENMGQLSLATRGLIAMPIDPSNKVWSQYHLKNNAVDQSYILQVIPKDETVASKIDSVIGQKGGCARILGKNLSFKQWLYKGSPRKTTFSFGDVPFKLDRDKFLYITDIESFTCGSSTVGLSQAGASPFIKNAMPLNIFGKAVFIAGMGVWGILILAICLFMLFFPGYCLLRISRRSNRGVPWMAWVPIANLFLMCKIADVRYTWLFLLFLGIIPVLGIVSILGLFIYIWYRIAEAVNKPGWWGLLVLMPVIGIVAMGVLAFSD